MIAQYTITSAEWTAISTAGQNGACWLDEDNDGAKGGVDVRVIHSTGAVTAVDPTIGKRCYRPAGNHDTMLCTSDTSEDVYYARCRKTGDAAIITADFA